MTDQPIWDEVSDRAFAELQVPIDRQLDTLGRAALDALAPRHGAHVLDVGCGTGQTTLQLAQAVGAKGNVLGVDISSACLAIAKQRAAGIANIAFDQHDAQTHAFPRNAFDAVFSRLGVMFFADPVAAFRNIHDSMTAKAKLGFVCWREPKDVELLTLPFQLVKDLLPEQPPLVADAPGPFSLANSTRTLKILQDAGFHDIEIARHDEMVGAGDVEISLKMALRLGVLGRILHDNPQFANLVTAPLRDALTARNTPDGVMLNAACWIVTARASH